MQQTVRFCTTADGVRIAYATVGQGPPLVKAANWLNHLEFDWESPVWRHWMRELSRHHQLIRYDERGNGLSDWTVPEFSFESFVRDLEAVVAAAGLQRFALLGISQGGPVAVAYAVRHPEKVSRLVLYGAYARGALQRSPAEFEKRKALVALIRHGWGQEHPAFRQMWASLYLPGGTPEQTEWFTELQRIATSPENAARLMETLGNIDVSALLPRVTVPTLVLHARQDAAVPFEEGRGLAAGIPGARFVALDGKNHVLLETDPAWPLFLGEVRRFFGAEEPAGTTKPTAALATGPPPSPGDLVNHYQVEEPLGAGGMGVVYRARDTRLERRVALKFIGVERAAASGARERLLREARAASALNHPHICTIYEVGEAEGRAYIAMEHVEGRPLSELVPADGLPIDAVLRYGAQVADALGHAHERGIVHRDLKSANVVVTPDGRAKVLDFGLAGRVRAEEVAEATRSRASLTEEHALAGTLAYMAPEVLRGEPTDARSDLWALGVVLYEMATGKLPFAGKTGYELTSAILKEPPAALPARLPAGLRAIVQRLLAKEPGQRYPRAGEVRSALEALSSDTAIAALPASIPIVRRWWFWALAAPLLLIGLGVVMAALRGVPFSIGYTKIEKSEAPAGARLGSSGKPSANPEANEYFQKGILFLDVQFDVPRARQMLERALALDPHFAKARAVYGFTYVLVIEGGYSNDPALLYKAEEEARRALEDEPGLFQAHMTLAAVSLLQGRKELVAGELDQALPDDSGPLPAKMWWLLYHRFNGDYGRAEEIAQELLRAAPTFFPPRTYRGEMLREQGKLTEAIREQEKVLEQDPTNILALRHLSRAYLDLGDLARARATLGRARPEDRRNYRLRLGWALLLAREGKRVQARQAMDAEVEKYAAVHSLMNAEAAAFYAMLGEKEKALEWLDRAVRNGDERLEYFQRDPLLASIRHEPRFQQILDSIAYRRQQRAQPAPAGGG